VQLHDFRQYLFVQQFLVLVIALVPQPFANFFLQFVQRARLADVFRKFIV